MDRNIPAGIHEIIGERPFQVNKVGMSGAGVLCFDDMVLKIVEQGEEWERELAMLSWLKGRLPVPEVIRAEMADGTGYLLMSRVEGDMLCDTGILADPGRLVKLLAQGLRMLWGVDVGECPCPNGLERKLQAAEYNVTNHLCDLENVGPDTYGENGFRSPEHLLEWLKQNKPAERPCLTHGDFCLPNIFAGRDGISGFIDWGRGGLADPCQDIAICYRSLRDNLEGRYGGSRTDFAPERLFDELEIRPDWELIRYYILLDELF